MHSYKNTEEGAPGTNPWLDLSHIMGRLCISDEMAKTSTRNMSISLLAKNIPQTASEKNKNAKRKTYPSSKQYLAPPETKEGPEYVNTSTQKISGVASWQIIEKVSTYLINCIIKCQNAKWEGIRNF